MSLIMLLIVCFPARAQMWLNSKYRLLVYGYMACAFQTLNRMSGFPEWWEILHALSIWIIL